MFDELLKREFEYHKSQIESKVMAFRTVNLAGDIFYIFVVGDMVDTCFNPLPVNGRMIVIGMIL